MILVMEGGAHGNWATDFQEYMIVPRKDKFPLFKDALRAGAEVFHAIHDILVEKHYSATVGFEGAFAPIQIQSNTEAFDIMLDGIESAGYKPEEDIFISIDIAASEFYDSNLKSYILKREGKTLTTDEWLQLQTEWFAKYPINIIEDPMDQEDWYGWQQLVAKIGEKKHIVGDDLLTTNVKRINEAVQKKAANTLLVKPNQIGTITETMAAIKLAEQSGWDAIISHRSGETNDDMIADMVVGTYGSHSKFGGPDRGERLAKYNRLTEIEMYLGKV
jgi:enolase